MKGNKIFAVVVTYNGEPWVENCLRSLKDSILPVSIVLVDNFSTDGTKKIIQEQFPDCFLIEPGVNLGFGKANNLGISYAIANGADYVFLLNQDAWILPDTLKVLLSTIKKENMVGILSPIHLDGSGQKLDLNFLSYLEESSTPGFLSDAVLNKLKDFYETGFVNAAAWLISRECLLKVGGFDPVFPHYGEDNDYVKRVLFHGYKVGVAKCFIYHERIISRKERGRDPHELNINRLHILNLFVLKNLNKPFILNIFSFYRRNFVKIIQYVLDLKVKEIPFLIKACIKTTFILPKIYSNYKSSKDKTKPFLSN